MGMKTGLAALLFLLGLAPAGQGQQILDTKTIAIGNVIRSPAVAVAGTGDFLVAWNDLDASFSRNEALVRLFDPNGRPKGPAFPLRRGQAGDPTQPKVAADSQGNFVVVWQDGRVVPGTNVWQGGDGDGLGVFVQRFARTGKRLGPAFRASRSVAGHQAYPNVAMDVDGDFVVVWEDCPRYGDCPNLHAGRFSATGERIGQELVIPVLQRGSIDGQPLPTPTPHVAMEPGGFVVGWTEQKNCFRSYQESISVVAHFTDSGQPAGEPFRLDDGTCDATGWQLAALTADRTGSSAAFFNGVRNSFQLFEPDGDPAGPREVIGRPNACPGGAAFERGCEKISSVAMAPDGQFAVVWEFARTSPNPSAPVHFLLGQFFDPAGRPVGDRFEVVSSTLGSVLGESAAFLTPDGTLTVVWSQEDADGSGSRLLLRRIRRD